MIDHPRSAIETALGVRLPEGMTVSVLAESRDQLCLVLPVDLSRIADSAVAAATGDVSDADPDRRPRAV